jgi:hypothetical protein
MRYVLLLFLAALAVVLVLQLGAGRKANPVVQSFAALDKAKAAALPSQLQQVEAALEAFADEHGAGPGDLAELVPGQLRSADLLIDPWGTRLRLEKDSAGQAVLVCAGPDRAFATADDIRRSSR